MANYTLDNLEKERSDQFQKWHKRCRPKNDNEVFPQYAPFKYIFTPTGIGVCVHIVCPYCGKERDITNVDCW